MKIYTRTGDTGETALFGGGRVPKDHPRTSAYGDVDELNCAVGVVRATVPAELFDELLEGIQRDLFSIGGRLATPEPGTWALFALGTGGLVVVLLRRRRRLVAGPAAPPEAAAAPHAAAAPESPAALEAAMGP